jgi:hypothetical protein
MENHNKSQPLDQEGSPTFARPAGWSALLTRRQPKPRCLLTEIRLLKDRGLSVEVVVADFVFKKIKPLKDRVYPAYLYTGINNSTRVTNRQIPNEDLLSRLDMILRGRVSNVGAPLA